MGEYLRNCEKIREMRTRDDVEVTSCLKRRKFEFAENSTTSSPVFVQIPTTSLCSSCHESGDDQVLKSILKSLDLKAEGFETDNSASFNGGFSENWKAIDHLNPLSEHFGDSEEMESSSTTTKKSSSSASAHRKQPSAAKTPPEAEIEEFFSAAEKLEQKRFAEKYNYNIVKDVPLEGRYQWVSFEALKDE